MMFYRCNDCFEVQAVKQEKQIFKCRCKSMSYTEIDLTIKSLEGVSIMDEVSKKRIEEEVTAWAAEHKIITATGVITKLVLRIDDAVKIGGLKKSKTKIHGPELDTFNGACRAIEQYLAKNDANTRANIALLLMETSTKIGIKYNDLLIDKYSLGTKVNIWKTKDSKEKEEWRKLSKEDKEKIRADKKAQAEVNRKKREEKKNQKEQAAAWTPKTGKKA